MKRIAIIGDVIYDESIHLEMMDMSAEGIPSYNEIYREKTSGGAANVAKHCARLGAKVHLINTGPSVRFRFGHENELTIAETLHISQAWMDISASITKKRFFCGSKKILKVNVVGKHEIMSVWTKERTIDFINQSIKIFSPEVILACDNGHGTFTDSIAKELVTYCKNNNIKLFVDLQFSQKKPNFECWYGATTIFLNYTEYGLFTNGNLQNFDSYHVKLGADGSEVWDSNGIKTLSCDGFEVNVVDTVGAGDAYLAAWSVTEDIEFANKWAAKSCTMFGTKLPEKD